jgi:hypothetical protein
MGDLSNMIGERSKNQWKKAKAFNKPADKFFKANLAEQLSHQQNWEGKNDGHGNSLGGSACWNYYRGKTAS